MNKEKMFLTEKQYSLLLKLYENSVETSIRSVNKSQSELANELGITRQALSVHLRKLKEKNLIRTGRGFIDLTEKALNIIEEKANESFVIIKVQPQKRNQVYEQISKISCLKRAYRVTGEIDLIAVVNQSSLDEFLKEISKIDGITFTSAHVVITKLK
ncbi:MAG: Lrp/AsnC family transcriptional regulator [Candidatus Verstraetearchaeota archaeon]|nr:Lrp/AsnC family transcriptional regulator [Candidatus Culexarchaeum yellowstonense]MCS7367092.1 Lrp/AsnC family transcriptional regulator [Candidatus Culexarchaeum yellowstonense]NHV11797.1 Lrp/AsnC family transcriptional regulator [Candidatus Verstraetearchaeota archaeon]